MVVDWRLPGVLAFHEGRIPIIKTSPNHCPGPMRMHVSSLKELVEDGWRELRVSSVKVIRVLNQLYPKDPFVCPKISALTNQDSMERHTGFDHCFNWLSPPFSKSWFWLRQIIRLSITVPENQHETPTHLMGVSRTGFDYCSVGYLMI